MSDAKVEAAVPTSERATGEINELGQAAHDGFWRHPQDGGVDWNAVARDVITASGLITALENVINAPNENDAVFARIAARAAIENARSQS